MRDLFDRRLVVVTGKGGVGKSTVAAALGLAAAAQGRRTIVAEVAARDDVSRALAGSGASAFVERSVADGLHHISIDPERALEEYLRDQLPVRALADLLGSSGAFRLLTAATPGLRELLSVGKVWELAQRDRRTPGAKPYDLVVLDAPATGHGIALLTAPRTFAQAARVGPVNRQGGKIDALLRDRRRTAIVAVATPEEMPVNETLELRDALAAAGFWLDLVVANGVLPRRFDGEEVRALRGAPTSPAARAALSVAGRAKEHRAQLGRLRRGIGKGVECRTLPFSVDAVDLAALAPRLAR